MIYLVFIKDTEVVDRTPVDEFPNIEDMARSFNSKRAAGIADGWRFEVQEA